MELARERIIVQTEFFEVSEAEPRVFINLSLVFRVSIEKKEGNSVVIFSFLNSPEQSASYRLSDEKINLLVDRFT